MKRFKINIGAFLAVMLIVTSLAWGAGLFTRKDQSIYSWWRFYHKITMMSGSTLDLTSATITAPEKITTAHIANTTRSFSLPIGAAGVDGGNDIDDGSTPGLSTCDGIPCAVWANSGEVTAIGWTFRVPSDFSSGLVVYALISSNAASGAGQLLDWCVWENIDGTAFDAACISQSAVESTEAALNAKNDVLTLTSNATAEAAYTAGDWITLEFFNASTDDDDLELKGLEVVYTATS